MEKKQSRGKKRVKDTMKRKMKGERSLGKVKEQAGEELGTYLASASL